MVKELRDFQAHAGLPLKLAALARQDRRVHIQGDGVQAQGVEQPAVTAGLYPGGSGMVKALEQPDDGFVACALPQPNRGTKVAPSRVMSACAKRAAPHQMLTIICSMSCSGRWPRLEPAGGELQIERCYRGHGQRQKTRRSWI